MLATFSVKAIKITLGENGMQVNTEMSKKYMLATRRNCNNKLFGNQLMTVYLIEVRI